MAMARPLEGELGPLEIGEVEGVSACSSTNSFNIFCRWNTSLVFSTGSRFSCATGLIESQFYVCTRYLGVHQNPHNVRFANISSLWHQALLGLSLKNILNNMMMVALDSHLSA